MQNVRRRNIHMKIRTLLNILIVLSTSILVGIIAFDNLLNSDNNRLINIILQIMHISFVIGAVLNIIHFAKLKKKWYVILTAIPLMFFTLAAIGLFFKFKFSLLLLISFDFYLIFWFFFLIIKDFKGNYTDL